MEAMAKCIGMGADKSKFSFEVEPLIFLPDPAFGVLPDLGTALPVELDTDLDAVRKGALMETRFACFSSGGGESGRFCPPTYASLFAAVGSNGAFGALGMLPPRSSVLIFVENSFLKGIQQCNLW